LFGRVYNRLQRVIITNHGQMVETKKETGIIIVHLSKVGCIGAAMLQLFTTLSITLERVKVIDKCPENTTHTCYIILYAFNVFVVYKYLLVRIKSCHHEYTMDIWNKVLQYGYEVRQKKLDGLASWNALKEKIPENNFVQWRKSTLEFYNDLINLGAIDTETPEEANLTKHQWDRHHFLIQHGRIIKNNQSKDKATLRRLLQIAYNAGQF
jgi:hypothetical protein